MNQNHHQPSQSDRRARNAQMAQETINLLPGLLSTIPNSSQDGFLYPSQQQPTLNMKYCPGLPRTPIKVYDCDSFDSAIKLAQRPPPTGTRDTKPVLVQNLASHKRPGGGWLGGSSAQEESLCYRSSLSLTLKKRFYPISEDSAVYSPQVVIMRTGQRDGYKLMDLTQPQALPVVSVVSNAALRHPQLNASGNYRFPSDRVAMKVKMRSILRIAAWKQHRRLVLGAFGCGAFANPNKEVAAMWAEVFAEPEFSGGWWESVIFAVMKDGRGANGNFEVFKSRLEGMMV
ncbi:hypothetical protein FQN54_008425 [Arachnomyces sp. PD_36]|nr:hypothetical protein FQN54_008425 [Arachnomyces sp. PD_36]